MSKGIDNVRKSIQQRKQKRMSRSLTKNEYPERLVRLPSDEEKHGYLPAIEPPASKNVSSTSRIPVFIMKAMISVSVFFIVAIVMQSNQSVLSTPKTWTKNAMVNEFPFATVYAWYSDTFGSPLGFEPKVSVTSTEEASFQLPVNGSVSEHFQTNGTGIYITPEESEDIHVWEDGIVTFVGKTKDTHKTIVVQHANGGKTTYGNVDATDVHAYQIVAKNQKIGSVDQTQEAVAMFFSLEQNELFVDPIQVIKVDDQP